MPSPTDKIRAGLDKATPSKPYRSTDRIGRLSPRLAHLIGKKTDLKSLQIIRTNIARSLNRVHELREKTVSAIRTQTEQIRAHYDQEGYIEGELAGTRQDILTPERRKVLTDRALVKMKKKVVANVASEVNTLLQKVNAAKGDIKSVRVAWRDPVRVLARLTIDSAERERFSVNMANAGPVELYEYADEAIRENNMAKGAAILARVDRLPSDMKASLKFTRQDVAEALVRDQWNSALETLELSELSILVAGMEGREALGMKLSAADTLALDLEHKRVRDAIEREIKPEDFNFKTSSAGEPTKKPDTTPDSVKMKADVEQLLKDNARFHALYMLDKRTPEETAEALRLGKKLDILADEGDSK